MEKTSILITEDHQLIRESYVIILNNHPEFIVAGEADTGEKAAELADKLKPDVILMDISLPGINGIETTSRILSVSPNSKILAVSAYANEVYAKQIMLAGGMGYITKNSPAEELMHAIRQVVNNKKYICTEIINNLAKYTLTEPENRNKLNLITNRELEIIQLIRTGNTSREIAERLGTTTKTIEVHRYHILKKLKLKNTAALINYIHNQII
jgi:DNA-binding NarL/FixJ family response regulator